MYRIALRNLYNKKMRTGLALTGLMLGVLSIVVLISLSASVKASFSDLLGKMQGVSILQKNAIDDSMSFISLDYQKKLEAIPSVSGVFPSVNGMAPSIKGMKSQGGLSFVYVLGFDPEKEQRRNGFPYGAEVLRGRYLKSGDKDVTLIGSKLADDLNKDVGSTIDVGNETLSVIGVFSVGNDLMDGGLVSTIDVARKLTGMPDDKVSMYAVQLYDPAQDEKIAREIEFRYDELQSYSSADMSAQLNNALKDIDAFFWIISAVAMLIGAVGILNTILMSVRERYKEFGILRAMGWSSDDVVKLVITEAAIIGLLGGIIGVVAGAAIVFAATSYINIPFVVRLDTVAIAMLFSTGLGVVGGAYPAWKASRLDPIRAIGGR